MKLADILIFETDEVFPTTPAYKHARDENWNISDDDMEVVYKKLIKEPELDQQQVKNLANELVDEGEFSRNYGSAMFIIPRMHTLIHGMAPYGYTERSARVMFQPARPLIQFMERKGYDVPHQLASAKRDASMRNARLKSEDAKKVMSDYYKSIKNTLTRKQHMKLKSAREEIIRNLMAGRPVQAVFNDVLNR